MRSRCRGRSAVSRASVSRSLTHSMLYSASANGTGKGKEETRLEDEEDGAKDCNPSEPIARCEQQVHKSSQPRLPSLTQSIEAKSLFPAEYLMQAGIRRRFTSICGLNSRNQTGKQHEGKECGISGSPGSEQQHTYTRTWRLAAHKSICFPERLSLSAPLSLPSA